MELIQCGNTAKEKIDANQIHASISLMSISFIPCIQFVQFSNPFTAKNDLRRHLRIELSLARIMQFIQR